MSQRSSRSSTSSSSSSMIDNDSKKRVTFAPTAKARLALHLSQYTEQEKGDAFYTHDEFLAFKIDAKLTAQMIEKNHSIDEEFFSRRGCECRTNEATKIRMQNKSRSLAAVLVHQELSSAVPNQHQDKHEQRESSIAWEYAKVSAKSAIAAYMTGLADEKVARYVDNSKISSEEKSVDAEDRSNAGRVLRFGMRKQYYRRLAAAGRKQMRNSAA